MSNSVHSSSTVNAFQPLIVYANGNRASTERVDDNFCSSETNARLDYLQEQLNALISNTAEHVNDTLEDNNGSAMFKTERKSSLHGNEYSENLQYYKKRVQELKKSNSKVSTPSRDLQHSVVSVLPGRV